MKTKTSGVALAAALALALPGSAAAADIDTAVSAVQARTAKADRALDRAVKLFRRGRDASGSRALNVSRKHMGVASRTATRARLQADTGAERSQAARALALVAREQDENVEKLARLLRPADGRVENKVALAALSDTRGREKAIAVLTAVAGQVPDEAQFGIAQAVSALSQGRDDEVRVEAKVLIGKGVSRRNKGRLARAVKSNVSGQEQAADRLRQLSSDPGMPEQSKFGLQKAYDAVTAEHGSIADILSRFSERMPASIRSFVERIVRQAREDGQSMRENRPAPPSGQSGGTGQGAPEGTPSGAPEGTPSGPPAS
jgi:hypothetical protein